MKNEEAIAKLDLKTRLVLKLALLICSPLFKYLSTRGLYSNIMVLKMKEDPKDKLKIVKEESE